MIEVCKCCGKSEGVIIYRLDCTKGPMKVCKKCDNIDDWPRLRDKDNA